jgi:hypothetical protein
MRYCQFFNDKYFDTRERGNLIDHRIVPPNYTVI